jgi:flagellar brake protein
MDEQKHRRLVWRYQQAVSAFDPGRHRADKGYLLFEQGVDAAMNAQLLGSKECTFATTHDQVHIQFSSAGVTAARLGQEAVFRVPMPREMLRMQRREYYRLVTSVINPVKCLINTSAGLMESVVVDISIGGVGVLAYPEVGRLKAGEVYHGCRITLPGIGEFAVGLSVCTTFEIILKNGRLTHRAGCRFIDLPPAWRPRSSATSSRWIENVGAHWR